MSKFTSGPWTVVAEDEMVIGAGGSPVVYELNTNEADARLIAAAPEMYAVLQRVADHFQDTDAPLGIDARAILAKVEGQ